MPLNNAETQRYDAVPICRKDKIPGATTARREAKADLTARHERAGMSAAQPGTTEATGDAGATSAAGAAGRARRPWLPGVAAVAVRRHWLVSVLLAAGLVLRVLALAAYHPALIYVDTLRYLYGAS